MTDAPAGAGRHCLRCGTELVWLDPVRFRTGGAGGVATAILGGWAEAGESILELVLLGCPGCGEATLLIPELIPDAPHPPGPGPVER